MDGKTETESNTAPKTEPSWISCENTRPGPGRRVLSTLACGVAAAVLALLVATSEMLPLTWDEGESIDRARTILAGTAPADWPFTVRNEGHPAGYAVVIALGKTLSPPVFSQKTAWRFGPMLLMSIAAGAVFFRLGRQYGIQTGLFAVAAMLLLPRLFAHMHIAACDGPLCAAWLLAWSVTEPARRSLRCAVLLGALLGATAAMKFPGFLAFIPAVLAILAPARGNALVLRFRTISCGLAVLAGAATFLALNPPLWNDPFSGFLEHLSLNTRRAGYNVAILFFGRMYDLDHPLPWYNTIAWTLITVPVGLLFYAACGVRTCLLTRRGGSILLPVFLMLLVRALPIAPPHDGVRLFLPAFPFLAMLAGIGAAGLTGRTVPGSRNSGGMNLSRFSKIAAVVFAASAVNLYVYAPQWLSHYNILIGGLPGAARAGMEPTYWWDGLDRETLGWINANTTPGRSVRFSAFSSKTLRLYREWGTLKPPLARPGEPSEGDPCEYYILQRRPSAEFPFDRDLIEHSEPVYVKRLLGVPLIEIYPAAHGKNEHAGKIIRN